MSVTTEHPLATGPRSRLQAQLSRDDIGNQARYLLNNFIHDRLSEHDRINNVPAVDILQEPGTPAGPPMEHIREIGRALRCIGDELDGDDSLQNLISQIPPDAPQQTFMNVARAIFSDGIFNWGRVVTLFYFAYKMALKALDRIPLIRAIVNWVINYIVDCVAPWIIERGGWEAIVEYFGTPVSQMLGVATTGAIACGLIILWKNVLHS